MVTGVMVVIVVMVMVMVVTMVMIVIVRVRRRGGGRRRGRERGCGDRFVGCEGGERGSVDFTERQAVLFGETRAVFKFRSEDSIAAAALPKFAGDRPPRRLDGIRLAGAERTLDPLTADAKRPGLREQQ